MMKPIFLKKGMDWCWIILMGLWSCQPAPDEPVVGTRPAYDRATNSHGMVIDGKKEGTWIRYLPANRTYEYTCYHNGVKDSVTLVFQYINGHRLPLGMTVNEQREGIWFDPKNYGKSAQVFHNGQPTTTGTQATAQEGNLTLIGYWADPQQRRQGMSLNYSYNTPLDYRLSRTFSFIDDDVNGLIVFEAYPTEDTTYSCLCYRQDAIENYLVDYYFDNTIAGFTYYKRGVMRKKTMYDRRGKLIRKFEYDSKQVEHVVFAVDSASYENLAAPPPPLPDRWYPLPRIIH